MNITILGGNNHRAEMQELMALIAAKGIECSVCDDNERLKAVEFKVDNYDVNNLQALKTKNLFNEPNIPLFKRGKGKVKRW